MRLAISCGPIPINFKSGKRTMAGPPSGQGMPPPSPADERVGR